jgi:aminopeptidase N
MRTDTGQVFRLEDYRPSDYLIPRTYLRFALGPDSTIVTATLTVRRRAGVARNAPLMLNGDSLVLRRVELNGKALAAHHYTATPDQIVVPTPPEADQFELTIETEIAPSKNTALMGLYRSSGVYCTQCEAAGFRRITYFLDRPDILSVYTVRIDALRAEAPLLLSNGNPVECGDIGEGRHFAVWHDPFPSRPIFSRSLPAI